MAFLKFTILSEPKTIYTMISLIFFVYVCKHISTRNNLLRFSRISQLFVSGIGKLTWSRYTLFRIFKNPSDEIRKTIQKNDEISHGKLDEIDFTI